jgi:hypothetical protein
MIRIGAGQGVYGESIDLFRAAFDAGVDYVVCDSLAETTCGMLVLDQRGDETAGWAPDLLARLDVALPAAVAAGTRWVTNAGGVNPVAAHQRAVARAREQGFRGVKIAAVVHDPPPDPFADDAPVLATLAYAGAAGIVEALDRDADVVIAGRVADAALFLAPLVHEYRWAWDDWGRLAAGSTVGHLLECSGQCTGGTYSGDWWNTVDFRRPGPPIAEVEPNGDAVITKPEGTSGRVSFDTVREQLLYEVHDPTTYLTPDVVVDLASAELVDQSNDRVLVTGVRGAPRTDTLKGLRYSVGGYTAEVTLTFAWPDAEAKCRHVLRSLRATALDAGVGVAEWCEEYLGVSGFGGPTVPSDGRTVDPPEVTGRLAWRTDTMADAVAVQRLVGRIGLFSPPGLQGIGRRVRERGGPVPMLRLEPFLVDREIVESTRRVIVEEV